MTKLSIEMNKTIVNIKNMSESLRTLRNVLTSKYNMRYNTVSVERRKMKFARIYNEFQRKIAINRIIREYTVQIIHIE